MQRKTGQLTQEEQAVYDHIRGQIQSQRQNYKKYLESLESGKLSSLVNKAEKWGFKLTTEDGHLRYSPTFQPLSLNFDVIYVRHGKTEGNTEPRIFQGDVDYWENELTEVGQRQAVEAADKLDEMMAKENWKPDYIVLSPLDRAVKTAEPFMKRHPEIKYEKNPETKEMAFGEWDNVRVIDIPADSIAHLFYLDQNVLVTDPSGAHVVKSGFKGRKEGEKIPAETFVDVIDRMANAIKNLKVKDGAQVLFFGHSMAGAALSMLLGHGKCIDDTGALGFDGKYIMPNATPTRLPPKKPF